MRWLREKQYIMILGIVSLLIIAYIIITDEGDISYEPITVKEGDTLWTLADRYKWKMDREAWIRNVVAENNLEGERIFAGQTLMIPIPDDAIYIAIDEDDEIQEVKVASKR